MEIAHARAGTLTLWRSIGNLAFPLMLAEAIDFLVLLGVVAMMGAMGGTALYVRSLYQPVELLLLAFTAAFAVSNQVSAAISRGRDRPGDVLVTAASIARIWVAGGVCVVVVLSVAAPALADLVHAEPGRRGEFVSFLRWTAAAGLLVPGPALTASCLRGYGYARSALVVTTSTSLSNLGGVAVVGLGLGAGISAIPVSSAVSSVIGMAIGLLTLRRTELWQPAAFRVWQPDVLGHLRRIGVPVAASFVVIAVYSAAMLNVLGRFGPDAVAGFSVASATQSLLFLPGIMLGTATAILINQQRGAGEYALMRQTLRGGLELAVGAYVVVALLARSLGEPYAHLMNGDAGVARQAAAFLTTVGLSYAVQGPVLAALTVMEHTEGGSLAIVLNIIYFALVVIVAQVVTRQVGRVSAFYDTVALCNLIGVVVPVVATRYIRRLSRQGAAASPPLPDAV